MTSPERNEGQKLPEGIRTTEQVDYAGGEVTISEKPGTVIGRYKLLQVIGEGGFGVVYMAEQTEPVTRRVALKVIKLGMDTKQVIARFEAERQALALMDHPNIAKVLDAGATDAGRPYFVMELVRGVPITEYCDKNHLELRERLELFLPVCHAIQHAHQKGIIHRDIKPSNVLVTLHDGRPIPMVIDFGIAKATNQKLTEKTLFTNFAAMIGTPAYMSPEQAEMSKLDVDTRSDIYSLGVLLYELLTGTTPFPENRLRSAGYAELQRIIAEEEPDRPSTRLSTMDAENRTAVARNRKSDALSLGTLFRGDLDWVVMKCLEKDRTRRYETVNGLAADLERHLNNEPVTARPPTASYRFQKMVRRNKLAFASGTVVAAALVAALILSTSALLAERKARLQAAAAEAEREKARAQAASETVRADTVANFANELINSVVPQLYQSGHSKSVNQILQVADKLAANLSNSPLAEARLRFVLADAYDSHLFETTAASQQFNKVKQLATPLGTQGRDLSQLAEIRELAAKLWNSVSDIGQTRVVLEELERLGRIALHANPPDLEALAGTYGPIAEYRLHYGPVEETVIFNDPHLAAIRKYPNAKASPFAIIYPLMLRLNYLSVHGTAAEADSACDELFKAFRSSRIQGEDQGRSELIKFLNTVWIMDSSHFTEPAVRRILQSIDPDDSQLRSLLTGRLGMAVGRKGLWKEGLELLREAGRISLGSAEFWNAEFILACLLGETALLSTRAIDGLARFASGGDFEHARQLVEPLLLTVYEPEFLPTITSLVEIARRAPPWASKISIRPAALFAFRQSKYGDVTHLVQPILEEHQVAARAPIRNVRGAWAHFLKAAAGAKAGKLESAKAEYDLGMAMHSPALMQPGKQYSGWEWHLGLSAELVRRQAAALLGAPASPDAN